MIIKENTILLFQGDSVTDCHRDRENDNDLGNSYVKIVSEKLKDKNIKIVNRAISGNRVDHLLQRFDKDFKEVNPDNLILLFGVNDTWHDYPNCKSDDVFKKETDLLFKKITDELNCKVLILEPFIIGFKEDIIVMKDDLNNKINILKELSNRYNFEYLSFIDDFNRVVTKENESLYSLEGIHPLQKGYELMAEKIFNKLIIE